MQGHHIKSFKDYPELRLDEDNVAVLCRVCNLQIGDSSVVDWQIGIYEFKRRKEDIMVKNLTPELKSYKEEFDFLHKKIGELEWELATIYYGRKGIFSSEIEMLEDQLDNYRDNIGIVLEKVRNEVREVNHSK